MAIMTTSDPRYDGIQFRAFPTEGFGPAYELCWDCRHGETHHVRLSVTEEAWDKPKLRQWAVEQTWREMGRLCPVCRELPMPPLPF